jgi:hypothetical protein
MKSITIALVFAGCLLAVPCSGQAPAPGPGGQTRGAEQASLSEFLLARRADFQLSPAQVTRLTAIRRRMSARNDSLVRVVRSSAQLAQEVESGASRSTSTSVHRQRIAAREARAAYRIGMRESDREAEGVLTTEQRAQLQASVRGQASPQ